jgi:hypothetical protein
MNSTKQFRKSNFFEILKIAYTAIRLSRAVLRYNNIVHVQCAAVHVKIFSNPTSAGPAVFGVQCRILRSPIDINI